TLTVNSCGEPGAPAPPRPRSAAELGISFLDAQPATASIAARASIAGALVIISVRLIAASPCNLRVRLERSVTKSRLTAAQETGLTNGKTPATHPFCRHRIAQPGVTVPSKLGGNAAFSRRSRPIRAAATRP